MSDLNKSIAAVQTCIQEANVWQDTRDLALRAIPELQARIDRLNKIDEERSAEHAKLKAEHKQYVEWAEPQITLPINDHTLNRLNAVTAERDALEAKLKEARARIDALMFEYCPQELTPDQAVDWAEYQTIAESQPQPDAKQGEG